MLEEQKKNPVFAQALQEFERLPKCANIPLAGYMLDVVQRITRYKLLSAGRCMFVCVYVCMFVCVCVCVCIFVCVCVLWTSSG